MIMKTVPRKPEVWIGLSAFLLACIGLVAILSASGPKAVDKFGEVAYYLIKQIMSVLIGVLAFIAGKCISFRKWREYSLPLFWLAFVLLLAVLVPHIGVKVNGARRWIRIAGLTMQPSEFAKVAFLLFFSQRVINLRSRLASFWGVVFCLYPAMIITFVILVEPDLGTAMLFAMTSALMVFLAGARIHHLALMGGPVLAGVGVFAKIFPYVRDRWLAYIDPWGDRWGDGYQIIQSMMGFGSGGVIGAGLGAGVQKHGYLPYPETDFVLSTIGEELGLVGCVGIICIFAVLMLAGFSVAKRCLDPYSRLFSASVMSMLMMQVVINMSMVTKLVPVVGIPLPFLSLGGSSLVATCLALGLVVNVEGEERSKCHSRVPATFKRTGKAFA